MCMEGLFQGDLLLPTNCGHVFYGFGNIKATIRVGVPVLQEAVFVSDSAEALTLWTSQGASEATIDKITNDINLHIQSCVFLPYLA